MLVTAHGNSLRALVKHLDKISDDDIAALNIPTGIPLLYRLGDDNMPVAPGEYLDPEAAAAGAAAQKAKEVHAMAGGTWDKLEQVCEDRVARALSKLGVYTQNDVERLAERVDALSEAVNALLKAEGRGPLSAAKVAKPAAKRSAKRPARVRKSPAAEAAVEPATAKRPRARKAAKRKAA